jgi:hypothetical protein
MMKGMMIAACAVMSAATLQAQQQRAPGADASGFLAMTASATWINGTAGLMLGGGIFGIFGNHLRVGLVGAGLVTDIHGRGATAANRRSLTFAYGAFDGEYLINPNDAVRVAPYTMLGAGGLLYHGPVVEPYVGVAKSNNLSAEFEILQATDAFLLAEPGVVAEVSVADNVRLSAAAGYRFVYGVETDGVSNGTAGGPSGTLMLRVGVF